MPLSICNRAHIRRFHFFLWRVMASFKVDTKDFPNGTLKVFRKTHFTWSRLFVWLVRFFDGGFVLFGRCRNPTTFSESSLGILHDSCQHHSLQSRRLIFFHCHVLDPIFSFHRHVLDQKWTRARQALPTSTLILIPNGSSRLTANR